MPAAGGTPRVIAYVYGGQGTINVPSWSPDGRMLAFVSNTGTVPEVLASGRPRSVAAVLVVGALSSGALASPPTGLLLPGAAPGFRRPRHTGAPTRISTGDGVTLRGWFCTARGKRRGTVVYLHGIADNRGSSTGAIQRYVRAGFDVIAYDGRRHGDSER